MRIATDEEEEVLPERGAASWVSLKRPRVTRWRSRSHGVLSVMAEHRKYRDEAERLRKEAMQTDHRESRSTMIEIADL